MYPIIDFSNWEEVEAPVSGANQKLWLMQDGKRGIFKFEKSDYGDFWVEKMASDIFTSIGLKPMQVDMGYYQGNRGSMCYDFTLETGSFAEMDDRLMVYQNRKKGCYRLSMLQQLLLPNTYAQVIHMLVGDYLIGNYDRHTRNFGILEDGSLAPIYDSGSSLCYRLNPADVANLVSDKRKQQTNMLLSKSRCMLWDNNSIATNHDLMLYLAHSDHDKEYFVQAVERVLHMSSGNLGDIINQFRGIVHDDLLNYIQLVVSDRQTLLKEMI